MFSEVLWFFWGRIEHSPRQALLTWLRYLRLEPQEALCGRPLRGQLVRISGTGASTLTLFWTYKFGTRVIPHGRQDYRVWIPWPQNKGLGSVDALLTKSTLGGLIWTKVLVLTRPQWHQPRAKERQKRSQWNKQEVQASPMVHDLALSCLHTWVCSKLFQLSGFPDDQKLKPRLLTLPQPKRQGTNLKQKRQKRDNNN